MSHQLLNAIEPIADGKVKVVVAMSGGVDSSTVAAILKSQGHEVIGVTLQLYDYGAISGKKGACCAGQDIYDASKAAEKIGIPHYVLNYESIFKKSVIDDFADSYLRGETPIPCVKCNQNVKFRDLLKVAQDLNAHCLATGHYVRRVAGNNKAELHTGSESNKDQSYFLFTTTQEQLEFLRFPLGSLNKSQTRELAKYFGLEVADKPDSQDICFVTNNDYRSVIRQYRPEAFAPGAIVSKDGVILGQHDGIINFTIGQRRGIGVSSKDPLYVVAINPDNKEVVVGPRSELKSTDLTIKEVNWLGNKLEPDVSLECRVKLRSAHRPAEATISCFEGDNSRMRVKLYEPYLSVTPGQACVIYDESRVLGGGWIVRGQI